MQEKQTTFKKKHCIHNMVPDIKTFFFCAHVNTSSFAKNTWHCFHLLIVIVTTIYLAGIKFRAQLLLPCLAPTKCAGLYGTFLQKRE